jgi:hypothetical protein
MKDYSIPPYDSGKLNSVIVAVGKLLKIEGCPENPIPLGISESGILANKIAVYLQIPPEATFSQSTIGIAAQKIVKEILAKEIVSENDLDLLIKKELDKLPSK